MSGDDWIKILPVYGGAAIAFWGVWKWRLELHGRADFEAAKRCLSAVYKLRNVISDIRLGHNAVGDEQRREKMLDAMTEFEVQIQEAEVLWGTELADATSKLQQCAGTLLVNLCKQAQADKYEEYRARLEERGEDKEIFWIIWGTSNHEFGQQVLAAVRECEEVLRRRMRRSAKTFRLRVVELCGEARPHVKRIVDSLLAK
jgi:hypothetical protein